MHQVEGDIPIGLLELPAVLRWESCWRLLPVDQHRSYSINKILDMVVMVNIHDIMHEN